MRADGAARWLLARRAQWQALDASERAARDRALTLEEAAALARGYRVLGADLTSARNVLSDSPLVRQLEALYRRLHERLYRPYEPLRVQVRRLYLHEVPAAMRRTLPQLQAVAVLFVLAALAGAWLVGAYPELAALFASEEMIQGVQRGQLWTDEIFGVAPAPVLSAAIAANNVTVTLTALVLGVFYGLGTLYIVGLNGLMLGGIFAFTAQHALAGELLRFITAHGPAELSIIGIGGAAGLRLGEALARPGQRPRAEAFRAAVADSGRLLAVCVPALLLCAVIEAYVSPSRSYDGAPRVVVGLSMPVLLFAALFGRLGRAARVAPR